MAILSLVIIDIHTKATKVKNFDLKNFSFFSRGKVKETITFISHELVGKLETYEFQEYVHHFSDEKTYKFFSMVHNDSVYIACTTDDYPSIIAHKFLLEARRGNVAEVMKDYQDPRSKCTLLQVQEEVEKTKGALTKTLMAVLERNDKIENLAAKSEHLSYETKLLFKSARNKNRCC
jgi:synaptobrevin homolog YKT6